jgi:membrane protein
MSRFRHAFGWLKEKGLSVYSLLKETSIQWWNDNTFLLGAALAYYTIFSLAPVLLIAIAIAGLVFHHDAAQRQILQEISQTVGTSVGDAIATTLRDVHETRGGILATILGVIVLVFGATSVFAQLQESLNTIWKVKPKGTNGLWQLVKDRLLSFAIVVAIGFLLLVSLVVSAALAALGKWLSHGSDDGMVVVWQVLNGLVSFAVITLLFATIYKVLPDAVIAWKDVWVGAVVTALLFTAGKYLIGLYLGTSSVTSVYGAGGSLVLILMWVYYSSQILLFGAEFTQVWSSRSGKPIVPTDNAVLDKEQLEKAGRGKEQAA